MSVEENKQLVRRYQDIYNSNHLEELDDVMAADVRTPKIIPGFPPGLEGAKKVHELSLLGMTDFHTEILDMIAEGDKVVARVNITGLHTGNFFGIPATGKHVDFSGMYLVYRKWKNCGTLGRRRWRQPFGTVGYDPEDGRKLNPVF
jgi:predicted ester cyclase